MPTLPDKIAAEVRVRELLALEGLPPADRTEYGHDCIRLFWDGPRVVLVVDLEQTSNHPVDG